MAPGFNVQCCNVRSIVIQKPRTGRGNKARALFPHPILRKIKRGNKARAIFPHPILHKIKCGNKARALFPSFILRRTGCGNRARALFSHPALRKMIRGNKARALNDEPEPMVHAKMATGASALYPRQGGVLIYSGNIYFNGSTV